MSLMVEPSSLGRRIGIGLQSGEIALVFGNDPLGEVAPCERTQHLDEIVQGLRDIVAQRIDQCSDIEHEAGLAIEIDPLGEVAGHRGRNDAAHDRLEVVGHLGQGGLALHVGTLVLLGLLRSFALRLLCGFDFEFIDRLGDVADLVLAAKSRQHHVEVALRQFSHGFGQRGDRIGDRSRDEEGNQGAEQKHTRADDLLVENGTYNRSFDRASGLVEVRLQLLP